MGKKKIFIIIGIFLLIISGGVLFWLYNNSFADKKMNKFCECSKNCYTYAEIDEIYECMINNCNDMLDDLERFYDMDEYKLISNLNEENKQIVKCGNNCEKTSWGDSEQFIVCFEDCLP